MIIKKIETLIEEAIDVGASSSSPIESQLGKDLNSALASKGFGDKFDALVADGKKTADELGSDLADFFSKAKSGIGTVLDNVKKEIERTPGNLKQIGQNIKDEAERTPGNIKQIGQNIKDEIERTPGNIKQIGQNIKDELDRTPGNIKNMYNDAVDHAQSTLNKLQRGSEDISDSITAYFIPYQGNPIIKDLVRFGTDYPTTFNALVVAVPLVLVGALSAGSYAIVKKIKNMKDAKAELEKAGTELENATTDSAKAAATKKVALIGAKALLLGK